MIFAETSHIIIKIRLISIASWLKFHILPWAMSHCNHDDLPLKAGVTDFWMTTEKHMGTQLYQMISGNASGIKKGWYFQ